MYKYVRERELNPEAARRRRLRARWRWQAAIARINANKAIYMKPRLTQEAIIRDYVRYKHWYNSEQYSNWKHLWNGRGGRNPYIPQEIEYYSE